MRDIPCGTTIFKRKVDNFEKKKYDRRFDMIKKLTD
jgi:hypothetical protein